MKQLKFDQISLEKTQELNENELLLKNTKNIRKKIVPERKFKSYEPDLIHIDTKENSPSKNDIDKLPSSQKQYQNTKDVFQTQENPKPSKSSIKLPTINPRITNRPTLDNTYALTNQIVQDLDAVVQNTRTVSQGICNAQKHKSISNDCEIAENDSEDKAGNFLKYIQIRSLKPSQKITEYKSDLSIKEILPLKIQRLISTKISRSKDDQLTTKVQLGRSEKYMRVRRQTQQKSQKVVSAHSIKKERKAISITQPIRKKMTNTYWDFCSYLCLLNKIERPTTPIATYKAYIGKGNNSILIKNSLKSRFWWNLVDESMEVNLCWTQLRDNKFLQTLKSYKQQEQQNLAESDKVQKVQFIIPKDTKQSQNQKFDSIKQYVGIGLCKLLSNDEKKRLSKNHHQVQIIKDSTFRKMGNPNKTKMHNHLEFAWHLSNKKALYYNLKKYYQVIGEDPFIYIPLTFHVQKHGDSQWNNFEEHYLAKSEEIKKRNSEIKIKKKKEKNLWIVKPGQNSNQGCGIQVFDQIQDIAEMIKTSVDRPNGRHRSYIVQRYLMPFLYSKRKFDIRCYVLFTSVNGIYKAYWYQEGYIRTSSKQFTMKNLKNRFIHLTNDAVQKKSEDYGKYENGNKLSFLDFQKYLDNNFPEKDYKFFKTVYPAMIKRAADTIKSTCMLLDANKRQFSFEVFGLDFMIDEDFQTWLIEVNTNPCLQLGAPLLARIVPNMIQNALKIAVDPLFPPPRQFSKSKSVPGQLFEGNKFTLIFNSSEQQQILINLTKDTNLSNIIESDEEDDCHDDEFNQD